MVFILVVIYGAGTTVQIILPVKRRDREDNEDSHNKVIRE